MVKTVTVTYGPAHGHHSAEGGLKGARDLIDASGLCRLLQEGGAAADIKVYVWDMGTQCFHFMFSSS